MEELRAVVADRFVLKLINKKMVMAKDFVQKEDGAVILTDEGRKKYLQVAGTKTRTANTPIFKGKNQLGTSTSCTGDATCSLFAR